MSPSLTGCFLQGTGPLDSEVNGYRARCPILGLIVVIAAVVIGAAGVLGNRGS